MNVDEQIYFQDTRLIMLYVFANDSIRKITCEYLEEREWLKNRMKIQSSYFPPETVSKQISTKTTQDKSLTFINVEWQVLQKLKMTTAA